MTDDRRRKTSESAGPRSPVTARPCPFPLSPSPSSFRARPPSSVSGLIEAKVTYTLFHAGSFYVIERVPARVCQETGEEFFAPETVERIQALVKGKKKPDRMVRTPVYAYAWRPIAAQPTSLRFTRTKDGSPQGTRVHYNEPRGGGSWM